MRGQDWTYASQLLLAAAVAAYWVVFLIARRKMIARPHQAAMQAELKILCTEVRLAQLEADKRTELFALLDVDEDCSRKIEPPRRTRGWLWSGEPEVDASMRLAAVRELLPDAYSDAEVRARLESLAVSGRVALSAEQRRTVAAALADNGKGDLVRRRRRALLRELERPALTQSLSEYLDMLTLHRKSWWLALVSLSAVLVCGLSREQLLVPLLAGAIGGFLATVFRFTRSEGVPTEYQTEWAVITLAVPVGALGGAVAAVLLAGLHSLGLAGAEFGRFATYLSTGDPAAVWVVAGVGFVAGFSARFVERLAERLHKSVHTPPPGGPAQSTGQLAHPVDQSAAEAPVPAPLPPVLAQPSLEPADTDGPAGNGKTHAASTASS